MTRRALCEATRLVARDSRETATPHTPRKPRRALAVFCVRGGLGAGPVALPFLPRGGYLNISASASVADASFFNGRGRGSRGRGAFPLAVSCVRRRRRRFLRALSTTPDGAPLNWFCCRRPRRPLAQLVLSSPRRSLANWCCRARRRVAGCSARRARPASCDAVQCAMRDARRATRDVQCAM